MPGGPSSWRRTVTLRDGARVTLRPIARDDGPRIAAGFERLSKESRYRRFLTILDELPETGLDHLVDIDHHDHEAIVAVDPASGELVGVARYVRSNDEADTAEVAVTVIDNWQGRGVGRALLTRLTARARHEGVRRFSARILGQNHEALALLSGAGDVARRYEAGAIEVVIELPPKRGIGARLARVLRAAAASTVREPPGS